MRLNRHKLGVSPAITVAILVFTTLILAIGLYGYFTSRASNIQTEQQLLDIVYSTSVSVRPTVVASMNGSVRGGLVDNCILVTVVLDDWTEGNLFFTVLPFDRAGTNSISLYPLANDLPVDSACTPASCTYRVFPYIMGDADGDGNIGLLRDPSPKASSNVVELPLTCDNAYTYRNDAGVYVEPTFSMDQSLVEPSKIWTSPGEVSFEELGVNHYLPVWHLQVDRGADGRYSAMLAFYIRYPQGATDPVNLAVLAKVGDTYYIAALYRLPVNG